MDFSQVKELRIPAGLFQEQKKVSKIEINGVTVWTSPTKEPKYYVSVGAFANSQVKWSTMLAFPGATPIRPDLTAQNYELDIHPGSRITITLGVMNATLLPPVLKINGEQIQPSSVASNQYTYYLTATSDESSISVDVKQKQLMSFYGATCDITGNVVPE